MKIRKIINARFIDPINGLYGLCNKKVKTHVNPIVAEA
jgi:hypothetical protein